MNKNYFFTLMIIWLGISLVAFDSRANETDDSKVIWACKKIYTKENILWLVEWGDKSYIKVFDERIPAEYSLDGLEKRWNWGLNKTSLTYKYAITLGPDKTAMYYDFSTSTTGTAKARELYQCTK